MARFTETLLHRRSGPRGSASRLGLMLLRPRPPLSLQLLVYAPRIHVVPHLQVTLLRSGPAARQRADSKPAMDRMLEVAVPRERIRAYWHVLLRRTFARGGGTPARQVPRRRIVPAVAEKVLVRRLFARGERRAPSMYLPGESEASGAAAPRPAGVPRTVRRTAIPVPAVVSAAAALPSPPAAVAARPVRPAPSAGRHGFPERPGPAAPSPADLERLTDQVIRAVDRRIIAQRERMGKR